MQIVIEISKYDREWIKNTYGIPLDIDMDITRAIINGIPLPENHGRLIDADKLKAWFFRSYSNEENYSNIDVKNVIDDAPTILEATLDYKMMNYSCVPEESADKFNRYHGVNEEIM